jgi:DnaJ-class molecular chaperone
MSAPMRDGRWPATWKDVLNGLRVCPDCQGIGEGYPPHPPVRDPQDAPDIETCPRCNGTGRIDTYKSATPDADTSEVA